MTIFLIILAAWFAFSIPLSLLAGPLLAENADAYPPAPTNKTTTAELMKSA